IVSPKLQGQYSNEVVLGIQYDVGLDLVLGAQYMHRDLGRIIEDVSPDGGRTYVIANPGEAPDSGTVQKLQSQIDDLNRQPHDTDAAPPQRGSTYENANPGQAPDSGTVQKLQSQIDDLNSQLRGTSDPAAAAGLRKQKDDRVTQLALYNAAATFEKPKRDYNA